MCVLSYAAECGRPSDATCMLFGRFFSRLRCRWGNWKHAGLVQTAYSEQKSMKMSTTDKPCFSAQPRNLFFLIWSVIKSSLLAPTRASYAKNADSSPSLVCHDRLRVITVLWRTGAESNSADVAKTLPLPEVVRFLLYMQCHFSGPRSKL